MIRILFISYRMQIFCHIFCCFCYLNSRSWDFKVIFFNQIDTIDFSFNSHFFLYLNSCFFKSQSSNLQPCDLYISFTFKILFIFSFFILIRKKFIKKNVGKLRKKLKTSLFFFLHIVRALAICDIIERRIRDKKK